MSDLAIETPAEPAAPTAGEAAVEPVDPLAGGAAAGEATDGTEPVAPSPVAPTEPAFDPRELAAELEYVRSQLQQLTSRGPDQPAQPQDVQGFDPSSFVDEFGQLDPVAFARFQQARDTVLLQQFAQMVQPLHQQFADQQEAERQAKGYENVVDMIADNVARFGEFASKPEADQVARDRVYQRAEAMLPELVARYGESPRTAEIAIERAGAEERAYLQAVRGEGAAETANRLSTLAAAPGEPGQGATAGIGGHPEFKSPSDVVNYYASQARNLQ